MTVRWWDPGVPVDLLSAGGDPALDTANRLIALHRAGATALLTAAAVPLCDETTVAEALDMTAAVSAVEISKTSTVTRADVEIANHAADALYRSCTARGVIPPIAAARVAKVYGVPAPMLGRYPSLAGEAKTPDLVLTDTADRLLFGWVAAVTDTVAEGIAKAETPEQRRQAQEQEARDRTGRWAPVKNVEPEPRVGNQTVSEWLAGQLDTAPEVGAKPPPPRTLRRIRQLRQTRVITPKVATGKTARGKAATGRAAVARAAAADTAKAKIKAARAANLSRIARPVPAMFGNYADIGPGHEIPPVTFVLPLDEWEAFRQSAGVGRPGQAVFKAGDLATYTVGAPDGYADRAGSTGHAETLAYVADQVRAQPDHQAAPAPVIWELTDAEQHVLDSLAGDRGATRRELEKLKANRLRARQDELGLDDRDIPVAREIGHVDHYVDAADPDRMLLVYKPPATYDATAYDSHRPEIVLAEVDVVGGRGRFADPGSADQAMLEPNMGFGADDEVVPLMKYDRELQAAILVVTASPVTDAEVEAAKRGRTRRSWIKKAETPEQRRAAAAREARGAGGRWVAVATGNRQAPSIDGQPVADWLAEQLAGTADAPAPAPSRQLRRIRQLRQITPAAAKGAAGKAATGKEAKGREAAARIAAAARVGTKAGAGELPLDDGSEYIVLSEHTLQRRLGITSHGDEFPLDTDGREWLANQSHGSAEDVVVDLYKRGRAEWNRATELQFTDTMLFKGQLNVGGVDEHGDRTAELEAIEDLADELNRRFGQDKNLAALEVQLRRVLNPAGHDRVHVTVLANSQPLDHHQVIRRGDVDPAGPQVLTFQRKARAMTRDQIRNTLRMYWPTIDPANPHSSEQTAYLINQWVDAWEVHTPEEYLRDQ